MRWLVTGGSGFIGRYLLRELAGKGAPVVVYDIRSSPEGAPDNVVWVQGDILDTDHLLSTMADHKISGIVHLAFMLLSETNAMPYKSVQVNCMGMANVLEAAVRSGIQRMIWASSVQVYGSESVYGAGKWVDESAPRKPESLYGSCKVLCEDLAGFYQSQYAVATVGLRFSTVYGHGRVSGSNTYLCDAITKAAQNSDALLPHADHVYNLLYVKDAARAVVACMEKPSWPGRVYNICSGELVTVQQIADSLQRAVPEVRITTTPGKMGVRATPYTSPALAERDLGFSLAYPVEKALVDYVSEIRAGK